MTTFHLTMDRVQMVNFCRTVVRQVLGGQTCPGLKDTKGAVEQAILHYIRVGEHHDVYNEDVLARAIATLIKHGSCN